MCVSYNNTYTHIISNSDLLDKKTQVVFLGWRIFSYRCDFDSVYYCDLHKPVGLTYKGVEFPLSKGIDFQTFNIFYTYTYNYFPFGKIGWKSMRRPTRVICY